VIARLRTFTNRARQAATAHYFPGAQENLGVAAPHIRAIVRELKGALKAASAADVLALANAVIDQNTLEGRQAAYELLAGHKAAWRSLSGREVIRLGRGIDNWASVDGFCCTLAGAAWREGRLSDAQIACWARSRDRWWRRAALVATVPLNAVSKGGTGDVPRTLAVCEMLKHDPDEMVAKALSWALRELVRWDRQAVQRFLERHRAVLAKRVTREVGHKLETGRKSGGSVTRHTRGLA
jgi:3-methyladenine DNA glycosylase AlkD